MSQHIVRRNTGLPRINQLPPDNAFGSHLQIGIRLYDYRAFAAQLQRYRHQVFCSRLHHDFAYRRAACKEHIIKRRVDQRLHRFLFSFHDPDIILGEGLSDQTGDYRRYGWSRL
ncbi:hypothetical protein D3C76_1604950 [compost metagenome]